MSTTSHKNLNIYDLFKGDLQLVSPPNVYFELQKVTEDPTKSLADAAFIIEKDAALSLRLLKIVNSAFYGFPSKISSVDRAITLIGETEIRNITLSTIVIDKFSDLPGEPISMTEFWSRNLRCALLAQEIDRHMGSEFSDSIFLCGILHNIGQLIFFRRIPELARKTQLLLLSTESPTTLDEINIEVDTIGFDHYQAGAALTQLWKLPKIITESIRLHAFSDNTDSFHKIASIIRVADCYSKTDSEHFDGISNPLDISSSKMESLTDKAYAEFEDIFKVFYPG